MKLTYITLTLYGACFAMLFATWAGIVFNKVPGADQIVTFIQMTLSALSGHILTVLAPSRSAPETPPSAQAGFARPLMLVLLAVCAALVLSACGTLNAYTGAALNAGEAGYAGARQNIKSIDDMKMIAWADAACAMPVGALQRNATGNPFAVNAVLTACPIPNVGVIQAKDGQVQIQFTQPTPTAPYAPPAAAPAPGAVK